MRGRLIVIEGIDGAGKSSQLYALAHALEKTGHTVLTLREPTQGVHGRKLREQMKDGRVDPQEELELFIADRRENVEQNILPALEKGTIVLLDRYYFSTIAYQSALGLDAAEIRRRNEAFAPRPDLLVILEIPVEVAMQRITQSRGDVANLFEQPEYLRKVKAQFDRFDEPYLVRVDGTQSPEAITQQIMERLEPILPVPQDTQ